MTIRVGAAAGVVAAWGWTSPVQRQLISAVFEAAETTQAGLQPPFGVPRLNHQVSLLGL